MLDPIFSKASIGCAGPADAPRVGVVRGPRVEGHTAGADQDDIAADHRGRAEVADCQDAADRRSPGVGVDAGQGEGAAILDQGQRPGSAVADQPAEGRAGGNEAVMVRVAAVELPFSIIPLPDSVQS